MTKTRKPAAEPTVTFWGAARTVTGSMHQLDACGKTLLLDCGLFQGRRSESYRRNCEFPFRPLSTSPTRCSLRLLQRPTAAAVQPADGLRRLSSLSAPPV